MLLFATLIGSIISIFTEAKYKLKDAIQEVLEKNKEKVFSGQELLDALREGRYKGHNELISLHVIQIALNEMNSEYRENVPKATIWGYNQFIPRWNDCYNEEALKSAPSILVFENHYNNVIDILSKCKKEQGSEELLDYISKKSNLSVELLKDGKILDRILQCLYLFNMDNVPGNDSEKLRRYLRDDLNISWAENAEIHKSDDGKTICIFKDENSAEITIDEEQEKATLKISDVRTYVLKVKSENGKLNIYQCFYEIYSPRSKDNEKYKIVYSEDCASQIRSTSQSPFNILLFDKIITNSQKRTWFYPEIDELTKLDLLIEFTEHLLNNPYLFSWDNVPGNDNDRLLRYLREDHDIVWAEGAEFGKSDDGKTIHLSKDENSVEIKMDAKKEKASLNISDGRTHELKVKKENGTLNIYPCPFDSYVKDNLEDVVKELPKTSPLIAKVNSIQEKKNLKM
jgi:hypothetical protein